MNDITLYNADVTSEHLPELKSIEIIGDEIVATYTATGDLAISEKRLPVRTPGCSLHLNFDANGFPSITSQPGPGAVDPADVAKMVEAMQNWVNTDFRLLDCEWRELIDVNFDNTTLSLTYGDETDTLGAIRIDVPRILGDGSEIRSIWYDGGLAGFAYSDAGRGNALDQPELEAIMMAIALRQSRQNYSVHSRDLSEDEIDEMDFKAGDIVEILLLLDNPIPGQPRGEVLDVMVARRLPNNKMEGHLLTDSSLTVLKAGVFLEMSVDTVRDWETPVRH